MIQADVAQRRTVPSVRFWGTEVTKLEELQSRWGQKHRKKWEYYSK